MITIVIILNALLVNIVSILSLQLLNITLIVLTLIISNLSIDKWNKEIIVPLGLLSIILLIIFLIKNIFWFYYIFELLLVPIYVLIYYNGQTEDKIRISYKFIYYALSSSLLWLITIIWIYSTNIDIIGGNMVLIIGFLLPLLVKLPMVPFHLWLNDVHTSSPVSGSIILAGVILKISIYGLLCFFIPNFFIFLDSINTFMIVLSVPNTILSGLSTFRQIDYKRLIAYSSVNHMNLLLLPIFTLDYNSWFGVLIFSVGHGLISSSLFYHVNSIYERFKSKHIIILRGIISSIPLLSFIGLLFNLFNMALPPTINWIAELLSLGAEYHELFLSISFISLTMIISLAYTLWIWLQLYLGKSSPHILYSCDLTRNEFILAISMIFYIIMYLFVLTIV